jgi:hypothetical protein
VQIQQEKNRHFVPAIPALTEQTLPDVDHVAAFPARLALARWTRGGDVPHVFASNRDTPKRAAWYAHTQRQFQAWLEAGGFHQYELEK